MRKLVLLTLILLLSAAIELPTAHAVVLDLTTEGSSGTINNAKFYQFNELPTGSGLIDSFLRIRGFGVQEGYNTDGTVEFDTMSSFTNSIQLSASVVPIANIDGTLYREFLLDINQDGQNILSLDDIKIYLEATPDISGWPDNFSTPIYDLDNGGDNWIKMDETLNAGSGHGDMLALIPDSLFTGQEGQYIYLYAKFGVNSVADDGFEEWAYGTDGPIIPEPATVLLLGLGALALLRKRRP
ncbi:MAG: PEP-CTERM sorting domain-containing protein [Sedimentisphaerales bacterium]